jgi:hypothetical protein
MKIRSPIVTKAKLSLTNNFNEKKALAKPINAPET